MGSPTLKRRRLGKELRRFRLAQNPPLSAKAAAAAVGTSESTLNRIENVQTSVTPALVEALLRRYGVPEADIEALVVVAKEARKRGWWRRYTDVLPDWFEPYIGFEAETDEMHLYEPSLVPGLLQTSDYARAIIKAANPNAPLEEVERRVELRMERQAVRKDLPRMWIVLDESVLRRPVGGPAVMKVQLERLVEVQTLPGIDLQVLPFEAGEISAVGVPFARMGFPDPLDAPVVYLENLTSTLYLEEPAEIEQYSVLFDHLRAAAWSGQKTLAELRSAIAQLE